ncbi:MAG: sigma-70 family RNA polymerase sigma factor [Firmicutes bacterium]|jgi:RNA polymerase sigma-70 factor (ECF subfamily)|nr:sigma-70 family RNA polymerase sigma factor [Bacillota bacterium]
MTEKELERRLRQDQNDPQILERIIDLYGSLVYRLVARILAGCGDERDIEECCSDTYLELLRKREEFNPNRSGLRTWILMLARYRALDYRRRFKRKNNPAGENVAVDDVLITGEPGLTDSITPEKIVLEQEKREQIASALATLPPSAREILYRRYYLEQSIEAIAISCGISRGAVDSRLWRARRHLKQRLLDDYENKVVSPHE